MTIAGRRPFSRKGQKDKGGDQARRRKQADSESDRSAACRNKANAGPIIALA